MAGQNFLVCEAGLGVNITYFLFYFTASMATLYRYSSILDTFQIALIALYIITLASK